ncbi:MAG: hypothetical protein ACFB10_15050 [Salibacteraceae bacterium]
MPYFTRHFQRFFGLALLLSSVGLFPNLLLAQGPQPPSQAAIYIALPTPLSMDTINLDTLQNPFHLIGSTSVDYELYFDCVDTTDVDSVFVSLGTAQGDNDIGGFHFPFDPGSPPPGTTYQRIGNTIQLSVPGQTFYQPVYLQVSLKDLSGNISTPSTTSLP